MARLLHTFSGHAGAIYSLTFDGTFLYSAAADKFVVRWDLASGQQDKFAIKFEQTPYAICLFDNNSKLAVGLASGDLHFFDLNERKELKFYQQHVKGVFSILENAKMNHLYVTDADGNLSIWNTTTFDLVVYLPLDCGKVRRMRLLDDELMLVAQDGSLRFIDVLTMNEVNKTEIAKEGATSLVVVDDIIVVGAKDAHLHLVDRLTQKTFKKIPAHNYVIYDIIKLGENIVTASRDKSIKVWDTSLNFIEKIERKQMGHQHSVNALVAINDSQFASCSDDGKIKVWSLD